MIHSGHLAFVSRPPSCPISCSEAIAQKQLPRGNYPGTIAREQRVDIPPAASNNAVNTALTPVNLASTQEPCAGIPVTAKPSPAAATATATATKPIPPVMLAAAERAA